MRNGHYVIDAHCHVYPDKVAHKAAMNISEFYDGLGYVGGDVGTMLQLMDTHGTDLTIINSAAMTPHQVDAVNHFMLETVQAHPDRLACLGTLHPDCTGEQLDAAVQFMKDNGFHGIKIHPDMIRTKVDDPRMDAIYARCQEAELTVLLHTGDIRYDFSNPNRVAPVVEKYPGLTIVGGHFAGRDLFCQAADRLHVYPNLFADCSSSFAAMTREEVMHCFDTYTTKKVMFGTDYPMCRPGTDIDYLLQLGLSEDRLEDVLWRNAARIYRLTPPWEKQ